MTEYSSELTKSEIEESIDASDTLIATIDYINAMNYRSEIREFWRSLPSITVRNGFSADEVDVISAALRRRDHELSAKNIGYGATQLSPSGNTPKKRGRDWMELAANDRQDLEEN